MKHIEPANVLRVGLEYRGAQVHFPYQIDDLFAGDVRVTYPFPLDEPAMGLLPPIATGMAAFLAQLCLARQIILDSPSSPEVIGAMMPIIEMLYDIRSWRDELEYLPLPEIVLTRPGYAPMPYVSDQQKRASLLWSGGKDSTLASILLSKNGYEVHPVHISINAGAEVAEKRAVSELAQVLQTTYQSITFDFSQYAEIAKHYAVLWDLFPDYNIVPFGRDLILALLATPIAQTWGDTHLCMGHEHGSRTNYFEYRGKRIARDDVESIQGGQLIETFMREFVSPTIRFFPPVAGLPEYRILYELFTNYPQVLPHISFCFWGKACGRCSKCLRYYLVQRVLGKEGLLHFPVNPLGGDNSPDLRNSLDHWSERDGRSYTSIVLYCLGVLVARGDIRPGESLLERFAVEIYPSIKDLLPSMGERLMTIYPDPQVPPDFQID